jgi:uncharacterized protein involved in exopolysaccharide biosynthesis
VATVDRNRKYAGDGSLLGILLLLARNLKIIVGFAAVAGLLALAMTMREPRRYVADASFRPHSSQDGSARLAGLAAQFGVRVGGASDGEPLQFYVQLLRTRELLRDVAQYTYRVPSPGPGEPPRQGNLLQLYEVKGATDEERLQAAVQRLRREVTASADLDAGIVTIGASAPWPELAVQINQRLLNLVNAFNLEKRQTQARAERAFVEQRVEEARAETRTAEAALREFISSNRHYLTSDELRLEYERRRGEVEMRRQVYASLVQAYEEARIEEVRNTPVITVIQGPAGSAVRADRPLVRLVLAVAAGLLLGFAFVFGREYVRRERLRDPDAAEQLTAAMLPRLRRIRT